MTNGKSILAATNAAARPIASLQSSDRVSETVFDEAIRAQLMHVAIGVGGAGNRIDARRAATVTTSDTVTLLIDLSVHLSLAEPQHSYARERYKSGVLLIPSSFTSSAEPRVGDPWIALDEPATGWKSVCTTIYHLHQTHRDVLQSAVGDAFTLRLLFDAHGERQASDLADELCTQFAAWHRLTTSMREALRAIRSTLLEPQLKHCYYVPMLYRGAIVSKGWTKRIVDPVSFLHCEGIEESWSERRVPKELSDLFAARCEAVWADTAKLLHTAEPHDEDPAEDDVSSDAADEFVCADRMMSLWYGDRKRRRW